MNDLDVSSSHLDKLAKDLAGNPNIAQHFLESEQGKVKDCMLSLSSLIPRFRSLTRVSASPTQPHRLFTMLMLHVLDWCRAALYAAYEAEDADVRE